MTANPTNHAHDAATPNTCQNASTTAPVQPDGQPPAPPTARAAELDTPLPFAPRRPVGACPCSCNRGGFCGGCGHAGCSRG